MSQQKPESIETVHKSTPNELSLATELLVDDLRNEMDGRYDEDE